MEALSNWTTSGPATEFEAQTGVWTNWSRGQVMGATLTLDRQNGNLLIAFTAFFIGLVSSRFWRIVCFLLHRYYSTPRAKDVFHHQRQAVLCSSSNPESGLWRFGQLAWAWRHSAQKGLLRAFPGLLWAAVSMTAFTIASGFSSRISTGISDEVLLTSNSCAVVNLTAAEASLTSFNSLVEDLSQKTFAAANYAQQCYAANATGVFGCNYFTVSRLPTTVDVDAPCPFTQNICRNNDGGNIRLDTGYLNSHDHFGINTPSQERILFRQVMQCAPLTTIGFESNETIRSLNYTEYDYGPAIQWTRGNASLLNWTYSTPNVEHQYENQDDSVQSSLGRIYQLVTLAAQMINGSVSSASSNFMPAGGLNRTDADIMLYFLSGNGVEYKYRTDDPWYRGTVPGAPFGESYTTETGTTYRPEEAASPMGCMEQFQFCNTDTQHCGPLGGYLEAAMGAGPQFGLTADEALNDWAASDPTSSRFLWFTLITNALDPYSVVRVLGPQALLSVQGLSSGFQGLLPTDQWKHDVAHWWATSMALLQTTTVSVVRGLQSDLQAFGVPPQDAAQKALCANQRVRSTAYISFSLFGLCFIFITGFLIILTSYIIEPIFACLQRRHIYNPYKLVEWQTGDPLHLQRIAYQSLGQGTWSGFTDCVPLEASDKPLEPLALHHENPTEKPEKTARDGEPATTGTLSKSPSPATATQPPVSSLVRHKPPPSSASSAAGTTAFDQPTSRCSSDGASLTTAAASPPAQVEAWTVPVGDGEQLLPQQTNMPRQPAVGAAHEYNRVTPEGGEEEGSHP